MSDDSFIREVNEELRQDKVQEAWSKFGRWLLIGVVILLVATAAYVGWDRYQAAQADASGDRYLVALDLAAAGQPDEAVAALEALIADGHGAYPDLARMRIGSVRVAQGQPQEAVAAFDAVAADSGAPQPIRDMAAVRAAYVLVDSGTVDDVRERVERLTGDSEPLRFPAREAVALAAWKAGDIETAFGLFQQLVDDAGASNGISARARLMLDVIAAGAPAAEGAAPAAPQAATEQPVPAAPAPAPAVEAPASPDGGAVVAPESVPTAEPAAPASGAAPSITMPTTDLGLGGADVLPSEAAPAVEDTAPVADQPQEPASDIPPALSEPAAPAGEPVAPQGGVN
ncbi:tetratricopeptide repeat protein [Aurantimonas aggregata]|uniref:Ancillary SecYEG translocon subunit n=1 Tax=Aurantimonas aggregata TaxID=2047720 RepID=A0A6L9MDM1_9HYPH|nr:tetratricopeptide repeat protein [Aurantimonas aggregata]NDV85924.1 tetratricopeptide repeat protein [Aurantimonas aggregata]